MAIDRLFHAKTIHQCWSIARRDAEMYQRQMKKAADKGNTRQFVICRAARDAADRIALKIRFGRRNPPKPAYLRKPR